MPEKPTKFYIAELTNALFELDKRCRAKTLSEYESRVIYGLLNSWITAREMEMEEDAERETKRE